MIHKFADVQSHDIGQDTSIWQFSVVLSGAKIGNNCNINCNCFIENDVVVGNNVTIKSGVQLWNGVTIEDGVFVGPNVTFSNDYLPRSKAHLSSPVKTLVKTGASIGSNATLLPGIIIGEYAFIGAGCVVTKNIPPYTIWYGNPAQHKGYVTAKGIILDVGLIDKKTNSQYILKGTEPVLHDKIS